jgi:hypothetical protein
MQPLEPYVDGNGKRWLHPSMVKRETHIATEATISTWAERKRTPFGLHIESTRVPIQINSRNNPRGNGKRQTRIVISEETLDELARVYREVFGDKRPESRRGYSKTEILALEAATRRYYRAKQLLSASQH